MSTTLNGRSYVLFVKNQKDGCWKSLKKFIVSDHRDNGVFGQYIRSNMYQEKVQNKKEYIEFFVMSFIDEPQMVQMILLDFLLMHNCLQLDLIHSNFPRCDVKLSLKTNVYGFR